MGNGAIFLTNSPFYTSLLFVKSPLVTSFISKQSGKPYFLQLLASIVRIAFHRLDDQAALHTDIYSLLPGAKMMSLRILDLPETFSIPLTLASENSIIKRPSVSMAATIQDSLNQTDEEFRSKKMRFTGSNPLADSLEATTPVLKETPTRMFSLSPAPSFNAVSNNHVSWKMDLDPSESVELHVCIHPRLSNVHCCYPLVQAWSKKGMIAVGSVEWIWCSFCEFQQYGRVYHQSKDLKHTW